jgi:hypothetical protein
MDSFPLIFGLLCGGFFVLLILLCGAGLIFYALRSRKKAEASQGWPGTSGQISRSEVKRSASSDDDGNTSYSYSPVVEYTYQVGGQAFSSRRMVFGAVKGYSSPAKAEKELARHPAGATVTVYYNPENPAEAVLERTAGGFNAMLIGGIICLVIGLCGACPLGIGIFNAINAAL